MSWGLLPILGCGKSTFLGRDVVSKVILATMSQPILSPDGTQFWDGSAWQPIPSPTPSSSPDASHSASPAAAVAPAAPPPALHAAAPRAGLPNSWAVNKWAWRIALSPLLLFVAAGALDPSYPTWIAYALGLVVVIGATFAVDRDVRLLKEHGVGAEQSFTAAVLLLYLIGAPAYLIHRTRKAGTTALIPITWFVTALVALSPVVIAATAGTLPGETENSADYASEMGLNLESELEDAGAVDPIVTCPDAASYDEGDMVICDVTSTSDGAFEVVVNIRNGGYFEWQVQ